MDLFPFGFLDKMHWLQTAPACFADELALEGDVRATEPGEVLTIPALARGSLLGVDPFEGRFLGVETLRSASIARVVQFDGKSLMELLASSPFARGMRWENARDEFIRDVIQLSLHLKEHHAGDLLRLRTGEDESVLYPAWEKPMAPARQTAIRHA